MLSYKNAKLEQCGGWWVLTATLHSGNIVEVRCKSIKQVAQFVEEHDMILTIGDII